MKYWLLMGLFLLIFGIGIFPVGLFADEAEIGLRARQLVVGQVSDHFVAPFFYHHLQYTLGYLPVIAAWPFVALFNLNEFSVRLASVFYAILALTIIYLTLKLLKGHTTIPLLLLIFTPIFFHLSRINFGHTPSFMFTALGFYFYIRSQIRSDNQNFLCILSGACFGLSTLGHASYLIGTPVIILAIILTEIYTYKSNFSGYKKVFIISLVYILFNIPALYHFFTNPDFSLRFADKNGSTRINFFKLLPAMVQNYPKYFKYEYLFKYGERGIPNNSITRHTIIGNGIYLEIFFPLLILSLYNLLLIKDPQKKFYLPFFFLFFLTPIPDLITTKSHLPPYSFSLYYGLISLPFLTTYAIKYFGNNSYEMAITKFFILLSGLIFLANYYRYPMFTSGYWGWQFGPKPIISYFSSQRLHYDQMYLSTHFNAPHALLEFYKFSHPCENCFVGDLTQFNPDKKQLFSVPFEDLKLMVNYIYDIKIMVYYPNTEPAFAILQINQKISD